MASSRKRVLFPLSSRRTFSHAWQMTRSLRPHPDLDDKILTSWNGLMIGALCRAATVLGDPVYAHHAERAAKFIRTSLTREDGSLMRSYRLGPSNIPAFAVCVPCSVYCFTVSTRGGMPWSSPSTDANGNVGRGTVSPAESDCCLALTSPPRGRADARTEMLGASQSTLLIVAPSSP